jgi:hypothetical protein
MLLNFLHKANFHLLLNDIDQEIARKTLKMNCPYCSGTLHQANYPRSPMGIPPKFRDAYDERLSFCCDTCRKRTTPPSVKFFGRRWYPAPMLMLICLLSLGINERRLSQMKRHLGLTVSESTWKRWRRWWRESFIVTDFWRKEKGLVMSLLEETISFPRALLKLFLGTFMDKLCFLLRFLSPLTGGFLRAV